MMVLILMFTTSEAVHSWFSSPIIIYRLVLNIIISLIWFLLGQHFRAWSTGTGHILLMVIDSILIDHGHVFIQLAIIFKCNLSFKITWSDSWTSACHCCTSQMWIFVERNLTFLLFRSNWFPQRWIILFHIRILLHFIYLFILLLITFILNFKNSNIKVQSFIDNIFKI